MKSVHKMHALVENRSYNTTVKVSSMVSHCRGDTVPSSFVNFQRPPQPIAFLHERVPYVLLIVPHISFGHLAFADYRMKLVVVLN